MGGILGAKGYVAPPSQNIAPPPPPLPTPMLIIEVISARLFELCVMMIHISSKFNKIQVIGWLGMAHFKVYTNEGGMK